MRHRHKSTSVKDFTDLRLLMESSTPMKIGLKNADSAPENQNQTKGKAMSDIVDYAMPMMQIEKLMREIHDHCLMSDFDKAEIGVTHLIVESRLLLNTVRLMKNAQ